MAAGNQQKHLFLSFPTYACMVLCCPLAVKKLFNCLPTNILPSLSYTGVTIMTIQSNLFNKDTKGTEPSVRFTEVSVL